jgi:hypothetical protein
MKCDRSGSEDWQPTADSYSALVIDGVPYNKLHIISIHASINNTIITLSDHTGHSMFTTSGVNKNNIFD